MRIARTLPRVWWSPPAQPPYCDNLGQVIRYEKGKVWIAGRDDEWIHATPEGFLALMHAFLA